MNKRILISVFLTASLAIAPAITASEKKVVTKKTEKKDPLAGLLQKIKIAMPFLSLAQDLAKPILDGLGLENLGEAIDKVATVSIAFMEETERKGGVRIDKLIGLYSELQIASELLNTDLEKIMVVAVKPLEVLAPLIATTFKIFGKKTITIKEKDDEGNVVKKEIDVKEFSKQLPTLITKKVFKIINIYNKVISGLLEKYIETKKLLEKKIKEAKEKFEPIVEKVLEEKESISKQLEELKKISPDILEKIQSMSKEEIENLGL